MHPLNHSRSGRVNLVLILSVLANFGLAGGAAYLYWQQSQPRPTVTGPINRPPSSGEAIEALGRVQPISGVISLFGPPGDQIQDWKVELGSRVTPGQVLGVLRGEEERSRSLAALDAQIAEAKTLHEAIKKSRQAKIADIQLEADQALKSAAFDLVALQAKVTGLEEQLAQSKAQQERLKAVASDGVPVSAQEFEQMALLVTRASQELNAALSQRSKLEQTKSSSDATLSAKLATVEAETERGLAQVPLKALEASRSVAEQKLLDVQLKAPVSGQIVKLNARVGETLTNMPVLQLAETSQMLVVAEVYETDIPRLRDWLEKSPEIQAEVDARVLNSEKAMKLKGTTTLKRISPMIARNAVFALGPREDADRRVMEVEIVLDEPSSKALMSYIGLQVRVRFLPPTK